MNYVAVLPYIYQPYFDECIKTLKIDVMAIDNTVSNRGVAESWNMGIDEMRNKDADYLIILSAAMRFGESGGQDMLEDLEISPVWRTYFADKSKIADRDSYSEWVDGMFGYHCVAFHRELINQIGYFDTNFYPIYFEDSDYNLRIKKSCPRATTVLASIDAKSVEYNHAATLAGVKSPAEPLITYFATKWGIHPDAINQLTSYDHPFNNPDNSIKYFPYAHGREGK